MLNQKTTVILSLGLACLAGCKSTSVIEAKSPIVQRIESAGSGNIENLDEGSIQNWLAKHQAVAESVSRPCAIVSKKATADWSGTTEGRACAATARVMFYSSKDLYTEYTH